MVPTNYGMNGPQSEGCAFRISKSKNMMQCYKLKPRYPTRPGSSGGSGFQILRSVSAGYGQPWSAYEAVHDLVFPSSFVPHSVDKATNQTYGPDSLVRRSTLLCVILTLLLTYAATINSSA